MKFRMLIAASVFALGAGSAGAWAASFASDQMFCKAIGLEQDQQSACVQQMGDSSSREDRDTVAAKWVAISPLANRSPTSLYQPPVDDNAKNGDPTTPYKDKITVTNEVAAQIHRAMKMDNIEF